LSLREKTREELVQEGEELRSRLLDAEETLSAIRSGAVDSLVVPGPQGDQLFTLKGAETPYRVFVEEMNEGALTLSDAGVIVFCNRRFAQLLKTPLERVIGAAFDTFLAPDQLAPFAALRRAAQSGQITGEVIGRAADGTLLPLYLSLSMLPTGFIGAACVVATDLTDAKLKEKLLQAAYDELEQRVADRTASLAETVQELERGRIALLNLLEEQREAQAEIKSYIAQLEHTMEGTLHAVALMVEQRDPYTAGHERRVGELAAAIGTEMGLPEMTVKGLRLTSFVHDVGKIGLPAELLSKPTRLSPIEFAMIKNHAQAGYDILKDVDFPWPLAEVVLQHHERLDGSGYPRQLMGEQIILEARIIAVADVVEAMSSHRPYRPGLGIEAALQEIEKNSGTFYDAQAVAACLRLFREKGYVLPG